MIGDILGNGKCWSDENGDSHLHSLPLNMVPHQFQNESRDAESKNGVLLVLDSLWCDARGGRGTHFPVLIVSFHLPMAK
jgi:hypothetical protein